MAAFIYVIGKAEGPVKVGASGNPLARLTALQTGCPFKLRLLHQRECADRATAFEHEEIFGAVCDDLRMVGEWFDMPAERAARIVDAPFNFHKRFPPAGQDL